MMFFRMSSLSSIGKAADVTVVVSVIVFTVGCSNEWVCLWVFYGFHNDPDFGYVIKYPYFFQQEDTSVSGYQGYARFSFTNHANIILESYVTPNYSNTLQACADSLAQKLHSERTMQASNKAFILSGPVYENGVRVDGYSHYDKFIKSGRILFVYSLTYPDSYKPAMPRLFKLIDDWKVLGAY